ncbi:MAG: acyl-CoA/acyl-ACP dehydrogenase [Proteobacteria bacterium]|nr:acyl-CoA/acyl-ACP dehydrogenase [Pseudomonadota bacterium]
MNFDFSDDEKMVQDQTARFLNDHCDTRVVRKVLEGQAVYSSEVWQGLKELGLPGTAIPAAYGGVEAGYLTLCLVAEELGAHIAPVPFGSSIYLAAEALLVAGSDAQKSSLLPDLASGAKIGTLAVAETLNELSEQTISCKVSEGKLAGRKLIVPDGGIADLAIVLAQGQGGPGLYIAQLDQSVQRTDLETVDPTSNAAMLVFDHTPVELLGPVGEGFQILDLVYNRAAVLFAFEQLGGARKALDMAVAYAKERFAFGRPIGSFQALKHMLADMYVALKLAESNCYYAGWALANDSADLALAAATARVSATQAYQLCSRDNIQVHGGMGFTWEFDCHLYYRRSNYLTLLLGGLTTWENKLVNALAASAP